MSTLLGRLRDQAGPGGSVLVAFDFPIGLPVAYAQRAGLRTFRDALRRFGHADWADFFKVSAQPTLHQPFYPPPSQEHGEYNHQALVNGLGVGCWDDLLRGCDRPTGRRGPAGCLFFTLGGQQVGRGAIVGWRDVIPPSLADVQIWPFDGDLTMLLANGQTVIAEYYPRDAYAQLGFTMGSGTGLAKKRRPDRQSVAGHLLEAGRERVRLSGEARSEIKRGFRSDDDFDAMVGVLAVLKTVLVECPESAPANEAVRTIEGWMLGRAE